MISNILFLLSPSLQGGFRPQKEHFAKQPGLLQIRISFLNLYSSPSSIEGSNKKIESNSAKKKEMLARVDENKQEIIKTIQKIKFSNKQIRKFGRKVEKFVEKIKEREDDVKRDSEKLKFYQGIKEPKEADLAIIEGIEKEMRMAKKQVRKLEGEAGLSRDKVFKFYMQF